MRFSSFRRLCVQQKTKIAWCEPGLGRRYDVMVRVSCRVRFSMRVSFMVKVSVRVIQVAILSCNCEATQPRRWI